MVDSLEEQVRRREQERARRIVAEWLGHVALDTERGATRTAAAASRAAKLARLFASLADGLLDGEAPVGFVEAATRDVDTAWAALHRVRDVQTLAKFSLISLLERHRRLLPSTGEARRLLVEFREGHPDFAAALARSAAARQQTAEAEIEACLAVMRCKRTSRGRPKIGSNSMWEHVLRLVHLAGIPMPKGATGADLAAEWRQWSRRRAGKLRTSTP